MKYEQSSIAQRSYSSKPAHINVFREPAYPINASWKRKIYFALLRMRAGFAEEIAEFLSQQETGRCPEEIMTYVTWHLLDMIERNDVACQSVDGRIKYIIR